VCACHHFVPPLLDFAHFTERSQDVQRVDPNKPLLNSLSSKQRNRHIIFSSLAGTTVKAIDLHSGCQLPDMQGYLEGIIALACYNRPERSQMAMPFVKVCGIQNYAEAKAALDCGATALGFLVGITHLAEDKIDERSARQIVSKVPKGVNTVLVTHLLDVEKISELAQFVGTSIIQVHDEVPASQIKTLRSLAPGKILLKAVHVTGSGAIGQACSYAELVDGLLLDSRTKERLGGTGKTHDWSISRRVVAAASPTPVYLAGGLNPENVEQAIAQVKPAGVDVNSGVEDNLGRKDQAKMERFISASLSALEY